ncbi:MAG: ABC transporter ATP-binding protein [Granulosicoccus sp.]
MSTQARYLDAQGLVKTYRGQRVIDELDFSVSSGELVSLLGPSGCGKTTLLRIIAGLVRADRGDVVLAGTSLRALPAHRRHISVVFQNYALFPHLSVRDNVAFGLRAHRTAPFQIDGIVNEMLTLVRMLDFADRPITALSGGQQQRVAVARALAVKPRLLLLDEPFSALDRQLRETMQVELKTLLRERDMTAVFVTHDQDEALAVSDRIAVMNAGLIEQFDVPGTLYSHPSSAFTMDFVGLSSRFAGTVSRLTEEHIVISTAMGEMRSPRTNASDRSNILPIASTHDNSHCVSSRDYSVGTAVVVGVRPECLSVVIDNQSEAGNTVRTEVTDVMCLGSRTLMHCKAPDGDRLISEARKDQPAPTRGQTVALSWPIANTLIYAVA